MKSEPRKIILTPIKCNNQKIEHEERKPNIKTQQNPLQRLAQCSAYEKANNDFMATMNDHWLLKQFIRIEQQEQTGGNHLRQKTVLLDMKRV